MQSDHLKKFYERDAERFRDPRQGMVGRDLHVYPLLAGMSGTVLEDGRGAGSLLLALAKEGGFTSLVRADISERALARIASAWHDLGGQPQKLRLIVPEEDRLPDLSSGSMDLILCLDLDPYVVLDEFHRVASKNARCIVSGPNCAYIKYATFGHGQAT